MLKNFFIKIETYVVLLYAMISDAYLEHSWISMMEHFCKNI